MTAPVNDTIEEIARAAAREAVHETLMLLGVDASTPSGVQKAQRNFIFLDDLRTGTEAVKRRTLMLTVGAIFTAVAAWITLGMRH
jgi:hypothetical protein